MLYGLVLLFVFQEIENIVPSELHQRMSQDVNWMIDPERDELIYNELKEIALELKAGRVPSNIGCLSFDDRFVIANTSDCSQMILRYPQLQSLAVLLTVDNPSKEKVLALQKKNLIEKGLSEAAFDKLVELLKSEYNILFLREKFYGSLEEPSSSDLINGDVSYQDFVELKQRNKLAVHEFMLEWSNGLLGYFSRREQAVLVSYAFELSSDLTTNYEYRALFTEQDFKAQVQMIKSSVMNSQGAQ